MTYSQYVFKLFRNQLHYFAQRKRQKRKIAAKSGFTLIESVVAFSLIVGAAVGPFFLITRTLNSSKSAKDRLIAANLAQESIEIIRYYRDSNILAGCMVNPTLGVGNEPLDPSPDWRALNDPAPNCTTLEDGDWEMDATADIESDKTESLVPAVAGAERFLLYCPSPPPPNRPNYGLYAYSCPNDLSPITTSFKRRITLEAPAINEIVCIDPPGIDPCLGTSALIPSQDRLEVTVTVQWVEYNGIQRSMVQKEVLYNWR